MDPLDPDIIFKMLEKDKSIAKSIVDYASHIETHLTVAKSIDRILENESLLEKIKFNSRIDNLDGSSLNVSTYINKIEVKRKTLEEIKRAAIRRAHAVETELKAVKEKFAGKTE